MRPQAEAGTSGKLHEGEKPDVPNPLVSGHAVQMVLRFFESLNIFVAISLMFFPIAFIVIAPAIASSAFRGGWGADTIWQTVQEHFASISMTAIGLLLSVVWITIGLMPRSFKKGTHIKVRIGHGLLFIASLVFAYVSIFPALRMEYGLHHSGDEVIFWFIFILGPIAFILWITGFTLIFKSAT